MFYKIKTLKQGIKIGVDFRINLNKGEKISPSVIACGNSYKDNLTKIQKTLYVSTKEEILKLLFFYKDINFKQIEKILGLGHSTMWEHINNLEKLKLVKKEKKKEELGRKEFKINLVPQVKLVQVTVFELKKQMGKDEFFTAVFSNPLVLKEEFRSGAKQIVSNENTPKIISEYVRYIKKKLKEPDKSIYKSTFFK